MNYKKIGLGFIVLLVLIQLIRVDTTNPDVDGVNDYSIVTNAPDEISDLLKNSCYDCHSNETRHPWYSNIAPVSWMLKNHIDEGREHVNFSEWGNYSFKKKMALQEECMEELEKDKMPLKSYTMIHSNAELSANDKAVLIKWFNLRTGGGLEQEQPGASQ